MRIGWFSRYNGQSIPLIIPDFVENLFFVYDLRSYYTDRTVEYEERHAYAAAVVAAMLEETRPQVEALRRGLAELVPAQLLRLFEWREVSGELCCCLYPAGYLA